MTTVLALELVYEDVKARFALEAPDVAVVFGWRSPPNQLTQGTGRANRIAFVPGEAEKAGSYVGARAPGRNPRPLRTFIETCTVYCWAFDGATKALANSDLAQWRAARLLHDAAIRAIELAMRKGSIANLSRVPFTSPRWVKPDGERGFGAELGFVLSLESAVTDALPNLAGATGGNPPDTSTTIVEPTNVAPSIMPEIAPTDDFDDPAEEDPPPIVP